MSPIQLYTIGHSNMSVEQFIKLLQRHAIATLIDVRTSPYSRYNPQFNREALTQSLADQQIVYVHEGDALGGRPSDATCYKHGALPEPDADYLHEVDYREMMTRPWFTKGIARLLARCAQQTTAIFCSEARPEECHRHHLIALHLRAAHPECEVLHILSSGDVIKASQIHLSVDGMPPEQLGFTF